VKELLSALKAACQSEPTPSERESIEQGPSTWFRGKPAHASAGTVALEVGDDAKVIINEKDVRGVERDGERYRVAVSTESHVLLRIDKLLKATPRAECGCEGEQTQDAGSSRRQKEKGPFGDIEIGDIEVCRLVCGDLWLGSIRIPVCVPVDCKIIKH
jgi:hypothetical protein